jgi:putative ABC transport system ATP-binding protein
MIELKNIEVNLNGDNILKNISIKINMGDFITIIGPNGTGKSTFLNLISGKIKASSGDIFIDNKNVTQQTELERTKIIGRLFQDPKLNTVGSLSVKDNISLAMLKNRTPKIRKNRANVEKDVITLMSPICDNTHELLNKPMHTLSGGQRQMIALVMATICPPKILLLDEPTAALDPISAKKMLDFSVKFIIAHKITTLFITHDMACAQNLGNRLWIMNNGTIKKDLGPEKQNLVIQKLIEEISVMN